MRKARLLALAVLAVLAVAACGGISTQSDGAWADCGSVARPTAVYIRRTVTLPEPGWGALSVTQRHRVAAVRRLYYDMCVVVGHPDRTLAGLPVNCPADFGLVYTGVFYIRNARLASFTYGASGCESLSLTVGSDQASTAIFGRAAAAEPATFDADLATVLGIPVGTVHDPLAQSAGE